MTAVGAAITTWEEFLQLRDEEEGVHYELHDGEVVMVPPAIPVHIFIQALLTQWLTDNAGGRGRAMAEFPYRPATNLQFWRADVAWLPLKDWEAMRGAEYPVYAPPLIVEVLSPSNRPGKIQRQKIAAFSAGAKEFWIVDPNAHTVTVSQPGKPDCVYGPEDTIPVAFIQEAASIPEALLPVRLMFPEN
jgi:Uma2 family endonuclease